jgi:hypothetical protein
MYFCRYRPGQHTEQQIRVAQNKLFKVAQFSEEHLAGRLSTLLMHRAVVHIPEQALVLGPTAFHNEAFGERCVRRAKGPVTNHATVNQAEYATGVCLTDMSLELCKVDFPDIEAPMLPNGPRTSQRLDSTDADGVCLIGSMQDADKQAAGDEVKPSTCIYMS